MCYLGRGENEQEITRFCKALKPPLKSAPKTIVVDYKPAWDLAIKKVFPSSLIIRDGFHTVQLINRAILKELKSISVNFFASNINEVKRLYRLINEDDWKGRLVQPSSGSEVLKEFANYYLLFVDLFKSTTLDSFYKSFGEVFLKIRNSNGMFSENLCKELINRLPINGFTEKSLKYYRKKVKGALSLVMRQFRQGLEQDKREFDHVRYLLLKRPEKLSEFERLKIKNFLLKFPKFKRYRDLSLRISNIYHTHPKLLKNSIISDIKLWSNPHPAVKAAVKTLKKNVNEIFNFTKLPYKKMIKKYYKKVRVSPESNVRKIKDLVRKKFGFRKVDMTRLYLENQLNCHVLICQG